MSLRLRNPLSGGNPVKKIKIPRPHISSPRRPHGTIPGFPRPGHPLSTPGGPIVWTPGHPIPQIPGMPGIPHPPGCPGGPGHFPGWHPGEMRPIDLGNGPIKWPSKPTAFTPEFLKKIEGKPLAEAERLIAQNGGTVRVIGSGPMTRDYRTNRINLTVNSQGKVTGAFVA